MMLYKPGTESDAPPTQQEMETMGQGARVRISGGKFTVTDGPFTETKELEVVGERGRERDSSDA